jgi:hypothetical protein
MATHDKTDGTDCSLTHFELVPAKQDTRTERGTTMADRRSLKFLGFIFATVTLAVMLATGMVVKGYADGAYSLEGEPTAAPSFKLR